MSDGYFGFSDICAFNRALDSYLTRSDDSDLEPVEDEDNEPVEDGPTFDQLEELFRFFTGKEI